MVEIMPSGTVRIYAGGERACGNAKYLKGLVDLIGIEPVTSSMPFGVTSVE
jgi:hypothetical protein